jgi:Mn2+/Fe2+ NRAMP family transporter
MAKAQLQRPLEAPRGFQRIRWLGPGLLWMVAAAGSGELLFTPIVASKHGYTLLWALIAAVALKWFINREIGRYSVCTGETILQGFERVGRWAVWLIVIPQVVVAAAALAGLASAAGTALIIMLPGPLAVWTAVILLVSMALVVFGRYRKVELVARLEAAALGIAAIVAAAAVLPGPATLLAGMRPRIPPNTDYTELLPWLAYLLAGAAGLMWYSYWVVEKGYGAAAAPKRGDPRPEQLRGWLTQMTLDTTVAVVGATIITTAFLVLGSELLQPRGLVPEESRVAETLGRLFQEVWGRAGFWFMIVSVLMGLWVTALSNQDGFSRLLADGFIILRGQKKESSRWSDREFVRKVCTITVATAAPILLFWAFGKPVGLLKVAGAIEAAHIPVLTILTLHLNRRELPQQLQPSRPVFLFTAAAGLFFAVFAAIYGYQLVSGRG